MNKVFSVVFIVVVVFFSLWLKEPVKADVACDNKCYDLYDYYKNVCLGTCPACADEEAEDCIIALQSVCLDKCDVPKPPPKSSPSAAPTTPIIPPAVPSSAKSEISCPSPPTCPDLKSLGVEDKSVFLPDCVYYEGTSEEKCCGCRNINVLVDLLVKYANGMFMFVGGGALLFFVYGGFVILTAAGGERVKKGKDIIVAAVIGLIIIFTAQVGLKFILKALLTTAINEKPTQTPATLEGLNIKVIETK